jgi:hypothetical protein
VQDCGAQKDFSKALCASSPVQQGNASQDYWNANFTNFT